jgi:ornithine cyclodeaminase/alanine dehydrogenase-like protein (mu-crystallin family)
MSPALRVLGEDEVRALYDPAFGRSSVEDAYRDVGRAPELQSAPPVMTIPDGFRVKGAAVPARGVAGAFLYTREHPKLYLWSTVTAAPTALVACDWLSKRRVALTVEVAIRALARPDVSRIALFGGGPWAVQTCELLAAQWPGAQIAVVTSRPATAEAFAATMPANVAAAPDARTALRGAGVVITLTTAREPFLRGGWLEPGALLLSMGSRHEVEVDVLRECDALFVDDPEYVRIQGDIAAWLARGDVGEPELAQRLRGTIGQVLAGLTPGRRARDERLLAVVQGLTACDVALAQAVADRAAAVGVGRVVEL